MTNETDDVELATRRLARARVSSEEAWAEVTRARVAQLRANDEAASAWQVAGRADHELELAQDCLERARRVLNSER
jgi:hypothetical protein